MQNARKCVRLKNKKTKIIKNIINKKIEKINEKCLYEDIYIMYLF